MRQTQLRSSDPPPVSLIHCTYELSHALMDVRLFVLPTPRMHAQGEKSTIHASLREVVQAGSRALGRLDSATDELCNFGQVPWLHDPQMSHRESGSVETDLCNHFYGP